MFVLPQWCCHNESLLHMFIWNIYIYVWLTIFYLLHCRVLLVKILMVWQPTHCDLWRWRWHSQHEESAGMLTMEEEWLSSVPSNLPRCRSYENPWKHWCHQLYSESGEKLDWLESWIGSLIQYSHCYDVAGMKQVSFTISRPSIYAV